MVTNGAIEKLHIEGYSEDFTPILQILQITTIKTGYLLKLSDGDNYTKVLFIGHDPIPVPHSLILLQTYEVLSKPFLIILAKYQTISTIPKIGSPLKCKLLPSQKKNPIFTSINSLSYKSKSWVIKARVIEKFPIEAYTKIKGGIFFKTIILDEKNDTLSIIFQNDCVDIFYSAIVEKKVYLFSGGKINKPKGYKGKIQLIFDKTCKISEIFDDCSIKMDKLNYIDIKSIFKLNTPRRVDTYGMIKNISYNGVTLIEIQDLSNSTIQLFCSDFSKLVPKNSTIICNNVQFENNSGILISDSSSSIKINSNAVELAPFLNLMPSRPQFFYTIQETKEILASNQGPDELEFVGIIGKITNTEYSPF